MGANWAQAQPAGPAQLAFPRTSPPTSSRSPPPPRQRRRPAVSVPDTEPPLAPPPRHRLPLPAYKAAAPLSPPPRIAPQPSAHSPEPVATGEIRSPLPHGSDAEVERRHHHWLQHRALLLPDSSAAVADAGVAFPLTADTAPAVSLVAGDFRRHGNAPPPLVR
nr:extensin-like [Aegilops tauschii subsp. strangulata]